METESVLPGLRPVAPITEPDADHLSTVTRTRAEDLAPAREWSVTKRIGFRLAFTYFVLYAFPFPIGALPGTETIGSYYDVLWRALVPWVAQHVLHVSYPVNYVLTGSGDTSYAWVQNLIFCVLAITATAIWSVLDRERTNYEHLHHWLRLYVRIYVGGVMISYGAFKVIQSQFPAPNLSRLVQPYGESSPMGLLWTFMGTSYTYNLFTGAAEIVGGALLIIPAFATLGALVTIAAMGNVFILNMAYDVPVKLFSFNLIAMAVFILLPDTERLVNVFVLNRPTEARIPYALFKRVWLNSAILWLQLILLTAFLGFFLFQSWQQRQAYLGARVSESLFGIWSVHEYKVDGQVRPLAFNDASRWHRVIFEYSSRIGVQFIDAPLDRFSMELDEHNRTISLSSRDNPDWKAKLHYEILPPNEMILKGEVDKHPVEMRLERRELATFRLLNRGFHWISEAPFNR